MNALLFLALFVVGFALSIVLFTLVQTYRALW
jgi:hypothetical protein